MKMFEYHTLVVNDRYVSSTSSSYICKTSQCYLQSFIVFLLNIFIDHHTVKSHLLMHVYNTDTIYELKFLTKEIGYFYIYRSNIICIIN